METGGEGLISKRKRVRGKIGNPSKKPELKFCNVAILGDKYSIFNINGVAARNIEVAGVWRPYPLNWPAVGAGSDQRIGKRIRVKYLRLKGFVASSPYLIQQVRYRIVLYRTKKHFSEDDGVTEVYDEDWKHLIYNNYHTLDSADSAVIQRDTVHNFYMSFIDQQNMKDTDCKRRILIKGLLKPREDIGNYSNSSATITGTMGNQSIALTRSTFTSSGKFIKHFAADINTVENMEAYFPIDLTVDLNDNVDCEEYRYVIMVESDVGIGQNAVGDYSYAQVSANYFFRFIPQIYYFDD